MRRDSTPAADLSAPTITGAYLREIGERPLLDRSEEIELARRFERRRTELVELIRGLPAAARRHVAGEEEIPERPAFNDVDEMCRRLSDYASGADRPALADSAREAGRLARQVGEAREALITANLRLVVYIAKRHLHRGLSFLDLIQEGSVGLMRAVDRFEVERGFRFSTYAYWWINQSIERAIAQKSRTIRLPVSLDAKLRRVRRAEADLRKERGRQPRAAEVADRLGIDEAEVVRLTEELPVTRSLEGMGESRDSGPSGAPIQIEDLEATCPFEELVHREHREGVASLLQELNPRERRALALRYGLEDGRSRTLDRIGSDMRLSSERVRQLLENAARKIAASHAGRRLAEDGLVDGSLR